MIGNPRLWIQIIVNVTGIGVGIKVDVTGIRIGIIEFCNTQESELESDSHDTGIGICIEIKIFGQHYIWNRNQNCLLLESDLELESWISENPGIGIRIGIRIEISPLVSESKSMVPEPLTTALLSFISF